MIARCHCLFYRGSLATHRGDEGYGIELLEEACKLARNFWLKVSDAQYARCIEDLAMAYNKAGRRKKRLSATERHWIFSDSCPSMNLTGTGYSII